MLTIVALLNLIVACDGSLLNTQSSECRNAFNFSGKVLTRVFRSAFHASFDISPSLPFVFEDMAGAAHGGNGQRWNSMWFPHHPSAEVTVVKQYKFVYVTIRKNGNTEINHLIKTHFGVSGFSGCKDCRGHCFLRRCMSLSLDEDVIRDYFFFTFVRHPYDRYFSSMKQAGLKTIEQAREHLTEASSTHVVGNAHFETQALALFSPVLNGSMTVPFHFIGKLETYDKDLRTVFDMISAHAKLPLPSSLETYFATPFQNKSVQNAASPTQRDIMNTLKEQFPDNLKAMVKEIYKQDYACFDYA